MLTRRLSFENLSTRSHDPGLRTLTVIVTGIVTDIVTGCAKASLDFELTGDSSAAVVIQETGNT